MVGVGLKPAPKKGAVDAGLFCGRGARSFALPVIGVSKFQPKAWEKPGSHLKCIDPGQDIDGKIPLK